MYWALTGCLSLASAGAGPHALALASRHPDRVTALTVMVGAAPLLPEERGALLGVNRPGFEAAQQGWDALYGYLEQMRERTLSGGGGRALLGDAPAKDRKVVDDPIWQRIDRANTAEALPQGAEGWADETLALLGTWDFWPADVQTSVTWWHGADDANAPLFAAERVLAWLPKGRLHVWHDQGHFAAIKSRGASNPGTAHPD